MTSLIPLESIRDVWVGGMLRLLLAEDDLEDKDMDGGASSSPSKSPHRFEPLIVNDCFSFL